MVVVGLPALIVALVPDHNPSAEATVLTSDAGAEPSLSTSAPSTVAASSSSTGQSVTTLKAPSTTAKPVTTTTKPVTTTTVKKSSQAAAVPKAVTPTTAAPAPPPPAAAGSPATAAEQATLACVRKRESGGNYGVVGGGGMYFGAYQIYQGGWDSTARHAGRPDLVGVPPNPASPADQDAMALQMLRWTAPGPGAGPAADRSPARR